MKLINNISVNESLNAKAKELAPFLKIYNKCLMTAEDYRFTVQQIKELIDILNSQHPRTKPFVIYGKTDNGIYITQENKPDIKVATMSVHTVDHVYEKNDGICPVDMFTLLMTKEYVEANS